MKALAPLLLIALLAAPLSAETSAPAPAPAPAPEKKSPAPPAAPAPAATRSATPLAALARYKGKAGKPTNNVMTATRSGEQAAVRLVALGPGDGGMTEKDSPRLWWYQSEATRGGELEFVLSEVSASNPRVVLRAPLPPMPRGFNAIDLKNPKVNTDSMKLQVDTRYDWTINLRNGSASTPVSSRIRYEKPASTVENEPLEQALPRLADAGNWYELFDLTSSSPDCTDEIRLALAAQIGLTKAVIQGP